MRRFLPLLMGACVIFYAALALDVFPWLRGGFGWQHRYAVPEFPRVLPVLGATIIYVLGALRLLGARPALQLLWYFGGALILPLACLYITGDPLYQLTTYTLSGDATGMHMAGMAITDLNEALASWPALMPTYLEPGRYVMTSMHVALSPPGLPALYYGVHRILEALPAVAEPLGMALRPYQCHNIAIMAYDNPQMASAWIGVLMPLWAAFTVFPLYFARRGGKLAAAWWPLVPSVALFAPNWNTLYPLIGVFAYLTLDAALRLVLPASDDGNRLAQTPHNVRVILLAGGAGILCSLLTFVNISTVPVIMLLGLYVCLEAFRANQHSKRPPAQVIRPLLLSGIPFAVGALSLWGAYFVGYGVTPLQILATALNQHFELDRPYFPWVFLHIYDLLLFSGLPTALLALIQARRGLNHSLALALAITLVLLAISGTARGETGRVWLFFVPFMLLVVGQYVEQQPGNQSAPSGSRSAQLWMVTAAQAFALIVLASFLRVMGAERSAPPDSAPARAVNSDITVVPLDNPPTFAGGLTLIGASSHVAGHRAVDLTLQWRVDKQVSIPYFFSALPVGPDGKLIGGASDWQPFDTLYPTTCWMPGTVITETHRLPFAIGPDLDNYWISLAAYTFQGGVQQRATVTRNGSAADTQAGIGPLAVK